MGDIAPVSRGGPESASFRPDVEGLRAVAIVLVVLYHAGLKTVSGGFVGVDVFYVISGFLITGLLLRELARDGRISLTRFWARRVRRLLPLSALVLAATGLASWLIVAPLDRGQVSSDVAAAGLYGANWHFAFQETDYLAEDNVTSPVVHYWSLSVEEQFYVLWPLILLLVVAWAGGRRAVAGDSTRLAWRVGVTLGVIGTASLAASVLLTPGNAPFAFYGTHTRAWELAAGGGLALAVAWLARLPAQLADGVALAGVVLIVASAVLIDVDTPFPGSAAIAPVLGAVLIIGAGAASARTLVGRTLSTRPARYVGRISYAWYLWHWPCLVMAGFLFASLDAETGKPGPTPTGVVIAAIAVSLVLAAVSNVLVEQPVRHARWLVARPVSSLLVGAALTLIPVLGVGAILTNRTVPVETASASAASGGLDGQSGRPRPIRLQMTPDEARRDRPDIGSCNADFKTIEAPEDCQFGNPRGTRTIVLVGNSHAYHLQPAFAELARLRGWRLYVWAKAACIFFDTRVWNSSLAKEYTECVAWRTNVIDRIQELGHVDSILISRFYIGGRMVVDDAGDRVDEANVGPLWRAAARRTFRRLAPLADQVVVLRDTPRPPWSVPRCISENIGDPSKCDFPRAPAIYRDAALFAAERAGAAGLRKVYGADLTDAVCPRDPCRAVTARGVITYRDNHHLTGTYSRSLGRQLGAALDEARRLR